MKAPHVIQSLKARVGKVNFGELYTLILISLGLPYIVYMYTSIREAFVAFIVIQIALGLINARGETKE